MMPCCDHALQLAGTDQQAFSQLFLQTLHNIQPEAALVNVDMHRHQVLHSHLVPACLGSLPNRDLASARGWGTS